MGTLRSDYAEVMSKWNDADPIPLFFTIEFVADSLCLCFQAYNNYICLILTHQIVYTLAAV